MIWLYGKFDGNLGTIFKFIAKKHLVYFLWTWCNNYQRRFRTDGRWLLAGKSQIKQF